MNDSSRSKHVIIFLALCAMLLGIFIGLGTWQIKRLYWKHALIDRVEQRVHVPAVPAPERALWNNVNTESDEYRHVHVSGKFLNDHSIKVVASTVLGRGFWLMTPLRLTSGDIIFINRGFIAYDARPCIESASDITGLLRITEPDGAFLRSNDPARQQWYSRDVAAFAASQNLSRVAPFFIDADAAEKSKQHYENNVAICQEPVAGLTVIAFHNNHLFYAVTWYTLGFMVIVVGFIYIRRLSKTGND